MLVKLGSSSPIFGVKIEKKMFELPPSKKYHCYMGVSKNRGTPKWMVYDGKPY